MRIPPFAGRPRTRAALRLARTLLLAAVAVTVADTRLCACSGGDLVPLGTDKYFPLVYGDRPSVAQLSELGRRMFADAGLSRSGRQSCASCHDPRHAYGPPNALAVQPGGPAMDRTGFRNTPSLTYLHAPIPFTQHFFESEVTLGADDQGATGGRTWDGRVDTGHDQALMPLLDANEMANADRAEVLERLRRAPYAKEFAQAVSAEGEDVFDDPDAAVAWMTIALETFEQTPADFHPFTSKYDAYLRDETRLDPREQRGMELFNDMKKGNCASCHPGTRKGEGRLPIFTDFGFVALGVPRNRELAANRDPAFFDLGLCGPLRTDLKARKELCGQFRTPSLRNVALRTRFFHNGAVRTLREAVAFYATRDTEPAHWYPRGADGRVERLDDLPPAYRGNVEKGVPFKPNADGSARLSGPEVDAIVAFLETLTDGWRAPAATRTAAAR